MFTTDELQAIRLSLQVALAAVAVGLPPAVALGWWLARKRFRGKSLVETILNLPLVLPPVVTGYLLLVALGRRGFVGGLLDQWLGVRLIFTWQGAALASAVVAFPLMLRAIRLAFAAVDPRLEQAARTLGAGPARAFFGVSLPLARNGLVAGCVLGFARSLGEFGATLMIAGNIPGETRTIPLFIYTLLESPDGPARARRLIVASILIAAAAMFVGERLERRTALGRAA